MKFIPWLKLLDGCLANDDCGEDSFCDVDKERCEYCHPYGGDAIDCDNLDDNVSSADIVDQASSQTEKSVELRASNRRRKLISKIDKALNRLKDGTYGYCEETGEPIGLKRLIARPIATLSIDAQERHEKKEKIYVEN